VERTSQGTATVTDDTPSPLGLPPLTTMEEIQILMLEYNMLRAELLQRHNSATQMTTVFGTVGIAVITFATKSIWFGILIACFLLLIIWMSARYYYVNMNYAVKRLIELENEINDRAKVKLLVWENNRGFFSTEKNNRVEDIFGSLSRFYHWLLGWLRQKLRAN
jgi:hypothetical protein